MPQDFLLYACPFPSCLGNQMGRGDVQTLYAHDALFDHLSTAVHDVDLFENRVDSESHWPRPYLIDEEP